MNKSQYRYQIIRPCSNIDFIMISIKLEPLIKLPELLLSLRYCNICQNFM